VTDPLRDRVIAAVGDLFLLDAELGRGGMSVVYAARDARLNRRVALKVLPPELAFDAAVRERFMREAQTAARLNHPGIVPIYAVDERGGVTYIAMSLVDGESVAQWLHRERTPPLAEVVRVLRDVADALAYAHAHGVVHRDIKPDNILIERATGRVFVTDFGIARAAEAGSRLTITGIAVGTPTYMSPEQALGEREVDGRSDLYSLGVVAYQALTGAPPFTAGNTPALLMKHVNEPPLPLSARRPGLPAPLAALVERSLAKEPAARWPDAGAMRAALDAIAGEGGAAPGAQRGTTWSAAADAGAARGHVATPPRVEVGRHAPAPPADAQPVTSKDRLRAARRDWRARRDERGVERQDGGLTRREARHRARELRDWEGAETPDERIRVFRRKVARYAGIGLMLTGVNVVTALGPGPEFFWAIFPLLGFSADILRRMGALWADGIGVRDVFGRRDYTADARTPAAALPGPRAPRSAAAAEAAKRLSAEVLAGERGQSVVRAFEDRVAIREAVARLPKADRALIPDVGPTVDALVDRVVALAPVLQRLDAALAAGGLAAADARIAAVEREHASEERDRRLALLRRQRATLADLGARRDRLAGQMESATLALQNLTLDVIKLRSAGVHAALQDLTSATQEARAVSREIGHVLDAAAELKGLT
jgi:serine/threonine-protein kinase